MTGTIRNRDTFLTEIATRLGREPKLNVQKPVETSAATRGIKGRFSR